MSVDDSHEDHDGFGTVTDNVEAPKQDENNKTEEVTTPKPEASKATDHLKHKTKKKENVPLSKNPRVKKINALISKYKPTPVHKNIWISALLALLLCAVVFGIYSLGYNEGIEDERQQSRTRLSTASDGIVSNPFNSIVSGKVVSTSKESIEVTSTKGEKKTVKISNTTRITNKGKEVKLSDIKTDQKVQVFISSKEDGGNTATRIVVRD